MVEYKKQVKQMEAEIELAGFIQHTQYEDLPPEVIRDTKRFIFDTIGGGFGGVTAAGISQVLDYVRDMGGRESSTILGYGLKVPPANAALVNGGMCHARDFDGKHDRAIIHAGPVIIPAAFAVAEYIGGVTGKELINAITLGIEIHCRLGLATKKLIGWALPALYGYFGAATAAGKLLKMDEEHIINAWGIAYSQAAGNLSMIPDGALSKRLQLGFAASGGVLAGLLAEKGITGSRKSFTGPLGVFNLYQLGNYDAKPLTEELGKRFEVSNISYKPYPCARSSDGAIDAALNICRRYNIEPEQIEEVRVGLGSYHAYEVSCDPLDVKLEPRNTVDAQFSIPYTVACAIIRKRVSLDDFTEESIKDPVVIGVSKRVFPYVDKEIERETDGEFTSAKVEIKLNTGDTYSDRVDFARGHPLNPMSDKELEAKFRSCAMSASADVSVKEVDAIIDKLNNLETIDDIEKITGLFQLVQTARIH